MAQRKRPVRARSKATVQARIEAAAQRLEFSSSDFGALVSKKHPPKGGIGWSDLGDGALSWLAICHRLAASCHPPPKA